MQIVKQLTAAIVLAMALSSPASAHKQHKQPAPTVEQIEPVQGAAANDAAAASQTPTEMHSSMGEMMDEMDEDRSNLSPFERLLDWLGRLHPVIVHFPIAFFPAALFTAIVGRRRPAFAKPVQFLVVAGGIIAPIAAMLGWLDGGLTLTDTDPLLRMHRWLGSAIGVGALALGIWAMREPEEDRGPGMILGLAVITVAIVIQGWFGGALVHGMDHMNW